MREIGRKVAEILNEGLCEHRLRDEINKLIREKTHWEWQIIELGDPNYTKHSAAKMTDLEGNIMDVPNPSRRGPGYRYFGAAKKLPGVRELFEKPPELRKRRTRYDIYKRVDASYYGYRDEEDGVLGKVEMRTEAEEEWRVEKTRKEARKGRRKRCSLKRNRMWWRRRGRRWRMRGNLLCMCHCQTRKRLKGWWWRRRKQSS